MIDGLRTWLLAPRVTGKQALFWGLAAVAVPAMIRLSVDGIVTGVAITPFTPFVLLSAIFLGWRFAAVVAVAAATIADAFFIGPPNQLLEGPSDIFAVVMFLFMSAMIIGCVEAFRKVIADTQDRKEPHLHTGEVVFSLEGGQAWAGWQGDSHRVHLGSEQEVAEMMKDFLAQRELARHLSRKSA